MLPRPRALAAVGSPHLRRPLTLCSAGCQAAAPAEWRWRALSTSNASRAAAGSAARNGHDLYAVMGIPRTASSAQIKQAFYVQAKLLHPDAAGQQGPRAASDDRTPVGAANFIRLVLAYETLSDPRRRAAYDAQLRGGASPWTTPGRSAEGASTGTGRASDEETDGSWGSSEPFWRRWRSYDSRDSTNARASGHGDGTATEGNGGGSGVVGEDDWDDERGRRPGDEAKPLGGYPGIARRARRHGDRSMWAALQRVRDGPAFLGAADDFPYAFELDERNDPGASGDIVQMTVGSTYLGRVRGVGWEQLASGHEAAAPAGIPGRAGLAAALLATAREQSNASDVADNRVAPGASEATRAAEVSSAAGGVAGFVASFQEAADGFMASLVGGAPGRRIDQPAIASTAGARADEAAGGGRGASERRHGTPGSAGSMRATAGDHRGKLSPPMPDALHIEGRYQYLEFQYQGRPVASAVMYGDGGVAGGAWQAAAADASAAGGGVEDEDYETRNYLTIYEHNEDGSRGQPLAHVLGAQGVGPLHFRRVVACGLVSPAAARAARAGGYSGGDATPSSAAAAAGAVPAPANQPVAAAAGARLPLDPADGSAPVPALREAPLPPADFAATGPHNTEARLRSAVYEVALNEYAEGVWRKHTVRLVGRAQAKAAAREASEGHMGNAAADASSASVAAHNGLSGAAAGAASDASPDDDLGARLCSPRLRRLSDPPPGLPQLDPSGGLSLAAAEAQAASAEHAALWNSSHAWKRHSEVGPDGQVPTFSVRASRFATWQHGPARGRAAAEDRPDDGNGGAAAGQSGSGAGTTTGSRPAAPAHDPLWVHPGCATHTLVGWHTPGVAHQRWLRNVDGAVEASGTRVRLPDARFWMWEPRSQAHQRGGFYFECAKRGAREAALHPAVYVLVAAASTLEQELARAASERAGWRRGVAALRDAVAARAGPPTSAGKRG
jgi:curved DNA-binding protein CbpA